MGQVPADTVSNGVFYVEDEPVNVMLMQLLFERRPHLRLDVATSVEEALRMAAGLQPSLLLLDRRLPDGDGSELLHRLRLLPGWAHISAVAVTADTGFDISGTTFREVWRKPLNISAMLNRVDALLPAAAAGQPLEQPTESRAVRAACGG